MTNRCFPELRQLANETTLSDHWQQTLLPFWQQLQHGHFTGVNGIPIHYSYQLTPGATAAWVISSGRIETAVKYSELMYEMVTAGYSVFILDHRGQGRSGRLLPDPQPGYVESFQCYQQDLAQFLRQIVQPSGHPQHLLLAHSMGCAIAAALLTGAMWQEWHSFFSAAVFCSPMFGIHSGPVPTRVAEGLALAYCRRLRANPLAQAGYFPGQQAYSDKVFAGNDLTSSPARYQALRDCYLREPQLQLGGVSCQWLVQAILAMRQLRRDVVNCQTPVLLIQGSADKVVANTAQRQWFNALPADLPRTLCSINAGRHELLMEQDAMREQVFAAINQFLQQLA
ncbi:MAG: alpha/beta fold hydrolase [Alishewanella agri]|nr:alpha/beta fold hydrolase [Alishewanella agri]